ncbi:hypothetical protein Ade02nite_12730 [Paractinoplanes deccanensis]|uniref:HTH luxR-type domain-containing protein n=1 Tax=Paractinoplanes deccanensis TaxID=113561 RepID=A0ABQ3XY18_9ACTN|nr:LuxR C-terminal-related transcriptional regulator [Actinoplanes deccanensis]GID72632.1 hypothetical protein Ade02nite_12730 [Actinoplanes deccanensis]
MSFTGRFVGREADLAAVVRSLGTAPLVTLTGPGGAGKSTLAWRVAASSPGVRVADDGAGAAELLRSGARVVATAPGPLGLPGEVVHPVSGLDEAAAVQLFTDRARAAGRRIVAGPEVAAIGARLDGLPLAIELAARWARMLTPAEILAEVCRDRFALLDGLRQVIERDYRRLTVAEQHLAGRLAVHETAFDRETAGGSLRLLAALVDKSFVLPVPGEPARSRFRMLGSVRDFLARRHPPLTPRELQIARMVADGLTNREVAARLTVSVRTVESHLEHVRAKLGLRSRAQLGGWLAGVA